MSRADQLAGRIGGFTRWAREADRTAATATPRAAFLRKFEDQVDPERKLAPGVRAKLAESALRAHFATLSLKRWQKRRTAA